MNNPNEVDIIPLQSFRKDLTDYLTKLGVSGSRGFGTKSLPFKHEIILNCAGLFFGPRDRERMTVCPKHMYYRFKTTRGCTEACHSFYS